MLSLLNEYDNQNYLIKSIYKNCASDLYYISLKKIVNLGNKSVIQGKKKNNGHRYRWIKLFLVGLEDYMCN